MRYDVIFGFVVILVASCGVANAQDAVPSSQQSQPVPVAPGKSPRLSDIISEETLRSNPDEIAINRKLNICYHGLQVASQTREHFDRSLKRRDSFRFQR
jgi:hypothetical protein